jgi:cytochrome c peroxidase
MRRAILIPVVFGIVSLGVAAPPDNDPSAIKLFKPLPASFESTGNPASQAKVDLGRALFYDKRLSKANDVSCNSCHDLNTYGVDNQPTSTGFQQQKGGRNSPTVYNAAGHFVQFWDGRAADVEAQAKGPVMNPVEMAMDAEKEVVARLKGIRGYVAMFKAAFPKQADPVSFDNMAIAIGSFERGLVTPSRWDKYLAGDKGALTEPERAGFKLFVDGGCAGCHSGTLVGGSMYQKVGLVKPWVNQKDPGRYAVTKADSDKMYFKVPSLRNIAKTAPYFHDGSVSSLNQAVKYMSVHQCSQSLTDDQVKSVVTWLNALTGDIPKAYIKAPPMPN